MLAHGLVNPALFIAVTALFIPIIVMIPIIKG